MQKLVKYFDPIINEVRHVAVYMRVSALTQNFDSQKKDLNKWVANQSEKVIWYVDKDTGSHFNREGIVNLIENVKAGMVSKVVCWRIDRLGRNTLKVLTFFKLLEDNQVDLVSYIEGFDFSKPCGKLAATIAAATAEYELSLKNERQAAGIAAAKAAGKKWGGSEAGRRLKLTDDHIKIAKNMYAEGKKIAVIARTLGLCRPTIYKIIGVENTKEINL